MARAFSGHRLRRARCAAGLKPERLALLIDRSVWTVHAYERGNAQPTAEVLPRLAAAVGVAIDDLFAEQVVANAA